MNSLPAGAYTRAKSGTGPRNHCFFPTQFLVMFSPPPANRGASLFADAAPEPNAPTSATAAYRANIDGGSRGNPGPASYGVVIRDPRGQVVAKLDRKSVV